MSTVQAQRREESCPFNERVATAESRQSNRHPYSSVMSARSNDGAQTSSSSTITAANLSALVPPSMRSRTSIAATEQRCSDCSESSSSSRRRKHNSALLPSARKGSADNFEAGTGYRSMSPPRPSASNLCPPREPRRGSSLSDVSVSTAEEELNTTTTPPPPPAVTAPTAVTTSSRTVSASDYAPLPEAAETERAAAEHASPVLPKLARQRFSNEPTVVPQAPTSSPAKKAANIIFAAATPPPSSSATPSPIVTGNTENAPLCSASSVSTPPPPSATATAVTSTPQRQTASHHDSPNHLPRPAEQTTTVDVAKVPTPVPETSLQQRPLRQPALRHGVPVTTHDQTTMPPMSRPPPIVPRHAHSATLSDAEARADDTGFAPLPEIPPTEEPRTRHDRYPSSRTFTPDNGQANSNRTRSARRPTQSVQTARARAQQRRHAASSSPHSRKTPVGPQPEFFPGAKRLDDDRVPLSTKLILGAAGVVGVTLLFYFGRLIYRYVSVSIMEPSPPVSTSKFARARVPKKTVVTDKDAAKIAREIRDRIVGNMQSAMHKEASFVSVAAKESS